MKAATVLPDSPHRDGDFLSSACPSCGFSNPETLKITWADRSSMHHVAWDGCLVASLGQVRMYMWMYGCTYWLVGELLPRILCFQKAFA